MSINQPANLFSSKAQNAISLSAAASSPLPNAPSFGIASPDTADSDTVDSTPPAPEALTLAAPASSVGERSLQPSLGGGTTHDVVIIGSGPAGYTAAIYLGRAGYSPHVFAGELSPGGQLTTTTEVENFPGFPDGIQGPELMERMKRQAFRFNATEENSDVRAIVRDPDSGLYTLSTTAGRTHTSKAVIVCTGSHHRVLNVPGEAEYSGHGVSYCATCDGFFFKNRPIAVIGGGDSALTEALFLAKFGSHVTIVHRRNAFRASQSLVEKVNANPRISVEWNSIVTCVHGDGSAATGLNVRNVDSGLVTQIPANGIFIAIGTEPNSTFLHDLVDMDAHGHIRVDGASTRTSAPGVFAAGDVVDPVYQQAVSAAGMGCRAALDAQDWLESR